jgi:hypothetical protein
VVSIDVAGSGMRVVNVRVAVVADGPTVETVCIVVAVSSVESVGSASVEVDADTVTDSGAVVIALVTVEFGGWIVPTDTGVVGSLVSVWVIDSASVLKYNVCVPAVLALSDVFNVILSEVVSENSTAAVEWLLKVIDSVSVCVVSLVRAVAGTVE